MNTSEWKQNFSLSFLSLMQEECNRKIYTIPEAFVLFMSYRSQGRATRFWRDLSSATQVTARQLHDYFHNTWSKQFCSPLEPHRQEIEDFVLRSGGRSTYQIVKDLVNLFESKYAQKRFHYQTLYQFVNYHVKLQRKLAGDQPAPSSNSVSI